MQVPPAGKNDRGHQASIFYEIRIITYLATIEEIKTITAYIRKQKTETLKMKLNDYIDHIGY